MKKILISRCLIGYNCRYDGGGCLNEKAIQLSEKYELIPICPEEDGGLPTPRMPAEIQDGRVVTRDGRDVTAEYERGAQTALSAAINNEVEFAVLKARSPSCGSGRIYDGSFSGTLIPGDGIAAALLKKNGIRVITEEEL